ncbi:hypothetical protein GYMLUDRAFT_333014 [Collybiopsis luxurians FD-317 M1]|nr:hypothetical protein GYMLUDRAFT_333014 [Collybiopsis luxurians FD-317 M1]
MGVRFGAQRAFNSAVSPVQLELSEAGVRRCMTKGILSGLFGYGRYLTLILAISWIGHELFKRTRFQNVGKRLRLFLFTDILYIVATIFWMETAVMLSWNLTRYLGCCNFCTRVKSDRLAFMHSTKCFA